MFTPGETYRTGKGPAQCIFIHNHIAYLTFPGDETAHPYNWDGTSRGLSAEWDVIAWG